MQLKIVPKRLAKVEVVVKILTMMMMMKEKAVVVLVAKIEGSWHMQTPRHVKQLSRKANKPILET